MYNSSLGVTVTPRESGWKWISLASNYKGLKADVVKCKWQRRRVGGTVEPIACKEYTKRGFASSASGASKQRFLMCPYLSSETEQKWYSLCAFHNVGGGGELLPVLCMYRDSKESKQHSNCMKYNWKGLLEDILPIPLPPVGHLCVKLPLTNVLLNPALMDSVLGDLFQFLTPLTEFS